MPDFSEDKDYRITVTTSFVGKFKRFVLDPGTGAKLAVFETGGSGRNGVYERAVPVTNIVDTELTKTQ